MVGFRNVVVHEYAPVDLTKVHQVLTQRLGGLDRFCNSVIRYAGL